MDKIPIIVISVLFIVISVLLIIVWVLLTNRLNRILQRASQINREIIKAIVLIATGAFYFLWSERDTYTIEYPYYYDIIIYISAMCTIGGIIYIIRGLSIGNISRTQSPTSFCNECGAKIKSDASFCSECGHSLN